MGLAALWHGDSSQTKNWTCVPHVGRKILNHWTNREVSPSSVQFSSVAQSRPALCDPMDCSTPGFPCPTPRACSNSCSSSWWCHQSFPATGSFLMSHFFPSGGQSIGVSASASVLPMNIQDWFPLRLTGFVSLQYKGFSRVFSNTTVQRHQFFTAQPSLWSNSHIHTWLLEKPYLWLDRLMSSKYSLCFLICCLGWS